MLRFIYKYYVIFILISKHKETIFSRKKHTQFGQNPILPYLLLLTLKLNSNLDESWADEEEETWADDAKEYHTNWQSSFPNQHLSSSKLHQFGNTQDWATKLSFLEENNLSREPTYTHTHFI